MSQSGKVRSEQVERNGIRVVGRKLTASMMIRMGIPKRFWNAEYSQIYEQNRKLINPFVLKPRKALVRGYGMILWGDNGVGKTAIASVCMKETRRVGKTAYFLTLDRLIEDSIRQTRYNDTHSVIERCRLVDLLVIDDVGKETVNFATKKDTSEAMLESMIRERSSNRKSSIVTTNLSPGHMLERYGASFIRVLQESTPFLQMTGDSKRVESQKEVEAFFHD